MTSTPFSCKRLVLSLGLVCVLLLGLPGSVLGRGLRIDLEVSAPLLEKAPVRLMTVDAASLLTRGFPGSTVTVNQPQGADVLLKLRCESTAPPSQSRAPRPYPTLHAPRCDFSWRWSCRGAQRLCELQAATPEAVAAGVYALLQERLGYRFLHPRQTVFPAHRRWPLPLRGGFSGRPRFDHRGFHLHTLHPIELAEQLHDPLRPGAFEDVAEYLDWLARNGQNSFQFFLLREVDRERWPSFARRIVTYAQSRGISCGIELSLSMLQQQAFQALTLLRPYPCYRTQVDRTLAWLFQVPWDFVTLDATMGEHLPLLGRLLPGVQRHFEEAVQNRYRARLFYATHVIAAEEIGTQRRPQLSQSGILIHTVMDYSVSEPVAPVYGNRNQQPMLAAARRENARRETWFWPESSYWVCYDSPVPLLLLTYLPSRLHDIREMERIGVSGHLTFSTGWEWGYWLVDWSIARWSWEYRNGTAGGRGGDTLAAATPLGPFADLVGDPPAARLFAEALSLQQDFLKGRGLQRYLAALAPFSELPPLLSQPFQPDPGFPLQAVLGRDGAARAGELREAVRGLEAYGAAMTLLCDRIDHRVEQAAKSRGAEPGLALAREVATALRVGALRARHRAATLEALLAEREVRFGSGDPKRVGDLLAEAAVLRHRALFLVRVEEGRYRYASALLSQRRPSFTAYGFGYLFPVSRLFFWEREEEQVRRERFDPFFRSLWDFGRVLGVGSLISR
ncbi:hypothetical protein JFN93_06270 [Geomonas sp. Red875]|uniref:Uncharacterized protein n=1 Tax=Geomesophilobacter sediminis TaxID=2798584 RepID=A0A8J7JIM5_9BACT|nr:hypothetical protein [Geomesophilobacter sediminis]